MSNWNEGLYNKPPCDMDHIERNLHEAYESAKCVGGQEYVMKHVRLAAELVDKLRAENAELHERLAEARRLAEEWRDRHWDSLPNACKDGITWSRGLCEESGPPYKLPWEGGK